MIQPPRRLSVLVACLRGARVAVHIACGMVTALYFPALKRDVQRRIHQRWSRRLLDVLHVRMEVRGGACPEDMQGRLLVANHVSWLDVFAVNSVFPACFVAKAEVGSWPVIGWLCRRAGTMFIKRDIRRDAMRANREIAGMLSGRECVALFPEGTSSDELLPGHFHSSLMQGAIDAGGEVGPVAVRYHDGAGNACSDAAFVGDMSFAQSLWNILRSPSLHVTLIYLPPIPSAEKNRRTLTAEAHGAIHMALAAFSPNHSVYMPEAAMPDEPESLASPVLL